jgi:mannose-6-phosphate isomerase-like protein (cupin superfamily)
MSDNETQRPWGYYKVLHDIPTCKVKELVVKPGESLSMQKHEYRSEHWHVVSGIGNVKTKLTYTYRDDEIFNTFLSKGVSIDIPIGRWHQLSNTGEEDLHVIEIQYGDKCIEEDIEREVEYTLT